MTRITDDPHGKTLAARWQNHTLSQTFTRHSLSFNMFSDASNCSAITIWFIDLICWIHQLLFNSPGGYIQTIQIHMIRCTATSVDHTSMILHVASGSLHNTSRFHTKHNNTFTEQAFPSISTFTLDYFGYRTSCGFLLFFGYCSVHFSTPWEQPTCSDVLKQFKKR